MDAQHVPRVCRALGEAERFLCPGCLGGLCPFSRAPQCHHSTLGTVSERTAGTTEPFQPENAAEQQKETKGSRMASRALPELISSLSAARVSPAEPRDLAEGPELSPQLHHTRIFLNIPYCFPSTDFSTIKMLFHHHLSQLRVFKKSLKRIPHEIILISLPSVYFQTNEIN